MEQVVDAPVAHVLGEIVEVVRLFWSASNIALLRRSGMFRYRFQEHIAAGRISGLQGFPPEQSSTALHFPEARISERIVEQIVDPPGGGLQDFRPGLSSSSSYFPAGVPEALDEPGQGFFSHFSPN